MTPGDIAQAMEKYQEMILLVTIRTEGGRRVVLASIVDGG